MCFDEATGEFLWQLAVPKLDEVKFGDWHFVGVSSPPTVEDGRAYLVTNRCEVVCLDVEGMANGNQGPYTDEGKHMVPAGKPPIEPGKQDADILWLHDMVGQEGVQPHNASNCSILIHGDLLYVCTSNGVEWTHSRVANPAAPTLVVLDKNTGRLVARDDFNLGVEIIHGQWCSPALGQVAGRTLLFLGTGKGYLFAFEPAPPGADRVKTVWSFNGHPLAQTQDVVPLEYGYETKSYEVTANPVFYNNRIYLAFTQDPWHTGKDGWLTCIDATGSGDVTRKGLLWRYDDLGRSHLDRLDRRRAALRRRFRGQAALPRRRDRQALLGPRRRRADLEFHAGGRRPRLPRHRPADVLDPPRRQDARRHPPHPHARRRQHHARGRQRHALRGHDQAPLRGRRQVVSGKWEVASGK